MTTYSLSDLGWSPFFQQQLNLNEWEACRPARVIEYHRSQAILLTGGDKVTLPLTPAIDDIAIGDWLLLDAQNGYVRRLDRLSLFERKAAGTKVTRQRIAANIDTLFIACSLNDDFNLNRIERYLVLARSAGAEPVVVLTKADTCDDATDYRQQVQALDPLLMVETVNGLDATSCEVLLPWCRSGKTVALMGSSGVGKSTLINTLLGHDAQQTGAIREADSKGRHTTTQRSMHFLPSGGILLDTPGMRELQLVDCEDGIDSAFADISALAEECRYADCQHHSEPGCAVQAAIEQGVLDQRRLSSFDKLLREQALNSATLAEKRARDRSLSRHYRSVQRSARQLKEDL